MVVFGRRWGIASDDLVFPGCVELFVRVLWYVGYCCDYVETPLPAQACHSHVIEWLVSLIGGLAP